MLLYKKERGIKLTGESLNKLLELKELHKNKNIFKNYICLCGSNDDELIATEDRYGLECNFVICKNCGLVRMNPYYTEDFLKILYSQFYQYIPKQLYFVNFQTDESSLLMLLIIHVSIYYFSF